jgi:hypothetical protein
MRFLKRFTFGIFLILTLIIGIQIFSPSVSSESYVQSKTNALTVWYEQTFWEQFWGNGFWQLRRKFEASARTPNAGVVYENKKQLQSWSNNIDTPIQGQYEETKRYGHSVSATAKAKAKYFEAEVKYTFSYEKVTKVNTSITINPGKSVVVYQYDVRIKYHYVDVKVTKQKGSFSGFKDTSDWWWEDEVIREYSGNHIEVSFL